MRHTEGIRGARGGLLGEKISVRTFRQKRIAQIRGLGLDVTGMDEVKKTIRAFEGWLETAEQLVLRTAPGGTATASLATETANVLFETGKMKVGWIVCAYAVRLVPLVASDAWNLGSLQKNARMLRTAPKLSQVQRGRSYFEGLHSGGYHQFA